MSRKYELYQVVREGKTFPITELSKQSLIEELAKAIDLLEDMDTLVEKTGRLIKEWRFGK